MDLIPVTFQNKLYYWKWSGESSTLLIMFNQPVWTKIYKIFSSFIFSSFISWNMKQKEMVNVNLDIIPNFTGLVLTILWSSAKC
jgi:hypothetical protein